MVNFPFCQQGTEGAEPRSPAGIRKPKQAMKLKCGSDLTNINLFISGGCNEGQLLEVATQRSMICFNIKKCFAAELQNVYRDKYLICLNVATD